MFFGGGLTFKNFMTDTLCQIRSYPENPQEWLTRGTVTGTSGGQHILLDVQNAVLALFFRL